MVVTPAFVNAAMQVATASVPAAYAWISALPIGPFQNTHLQLCSAATKRPHDSGPISAPYASAGMHGASGEQQLRVSGREQQGRSESMSNVQTTSDGSTTSTPCARRVARPFRVRRDVHTIATRSR